MSSGKRIKALVLRTAGTNCDIETAFALEKAGAGAERLHINRIIENPKKLGRYHILAVPGGFSYGDDIASGKILANEIRYKFEDQMAAFIRSGRPVIGICNGFQVLAKAGFLPNLEMDFKRIESTLSLNDSARFEDRWVHLKKYEESGVSPVCVWTRSLEKVIYLPVAHGEGKFIPKNRAVLEKIRKNGQIVLQYCSPDGSPANGFPENPNGAVMDIAGICDPKGRVFGLMPHPERHIFHTHHPYWTRLAKREHGDGMEIFRNGVEFARSL